MLGFYFSVVDSGKEKRKFERLYQDYRQVMYQAAFAILRNEEDAEDTVQEAFLTLAQNLQNVHEEKRLKTEHYLIIIVRNIAKRVYNKRKRTTAKPLEDVADTRPTAPGPAEAANRNEESRALRAALERLSDDYKAILALRYFQELSVKEVARVMKLSVNAVYKKLGRAEAALKKQMEEEGGFDDGWYKG